MIKTRIAILETMHEFVINKFNDEENIMEWLTYGVPDCPNENDYEFIAESEENFNETVDLFQKLKKKEGISNG